MEFTTAARPKNIENSITVLGTKGSFQITGKNLNQLSLEKAKTEDPWKLITSPTLSEYPIAPNRKIITILGLAIGISVAISLALLKENKTEIIFSKKEIKKFIKIKFIEEINFRNKENFEEIFKLLASSKLNIPEGEALALIPIGELDKNLLDLFTNNLKKFMPKNRLKIYTKLSEAKECNSQIFLASNGVTKKYQVRDFENLLKMQSNETIGWILLI